MASGSMGSLWPCRTRWHPNRGMLGDETEMELLGYEVDRVSSASYGWEDALCYLLSNPKD